jgi:hypothetical protein
MRGGNADDDDMDQAEITQMEAWLERWIRPSKD